MVWGKMMLSSNGLSYMNFKVHVEINKANERSVSTNIPFTYFILSFTLYFQIRNSNSNLVFFVVVDDIIYKVF